MLIQVKKYSSGILIALLILLAGCQTAQDATPSPVEAPADSAPAPTTPVEPTATLVALAADVNGTPILLEEYEAELARYQAALGTELATPDQQTVLDSLIDELLFTQAAERAGFVLDEATLQAHIDQLGLTPEELAQWIQANGYSEESFRAALTRSIAAAWMRDQIADAVPQTAEQVHARQILLYNSDEAETILGQLNGGGDFATLAEQYDPATKGNLGWFPRGYLTVPELDDFIFALEPGEHSPVIETALGFHIVQAIEFDAARPLTMRAYRAVQHQMLAQWLLAQREQSEIVLYLP
ncbi:MAG: hypothetical protein HN413_09290 [Chloroflexi bacterium]|jgi:peptidyl-prolyl cis-trans isomerase C|nr:hypothetical protein [Chloroflexota bacterium]